MSRYEQVDAMSARQSAAVDEALRLVAQGMTPYAAAKETGIAFNTMYRAIKRNKPTSIALVRSLPKGEVEGQ